MNVSGESAWFDRSSWSVIEVHGNDRFDLLNRLTTNDLSSMPVGSGKQTVILTVKARIIDVVTVCSVQDRALLIASPEMAPRIQQWLRTYTIMDDVRTKDVSESTGLIEIMGPRASDVVAELTGTNPASLPLSHTVDAQIGTNDVRIVRMPSVMETSYWIIGPRPVTETVRATLEDSSEAIPMIMESEMAYMRVRNGMGEQGHEWTEAYNPLEAGMLHLTSFTKGCYIGQEVIARLDSYNKVKQRVMGFVSEGSMEEGQEVLVDGAVVGSITTVVPSMRSGTIGLGYIRGEQAHPEATVQVHKDGVVFDATIHLLPMQD
ncbi:folate-binding protein YgfZ [soil metagenome]